jgi:hypothetical protein
MTALANFACGQAARCRLVVRPDAFCGSAATHLFYFLPFPAHNHAVMVQAQGKKLADTSTCWRFYWYACGKATKIIFVRMYCYAFVLY